MVTSQPDVHTDLRGGRALVFVEKKAAWNPQPVWTFRRRDKALVPTDFKISFLSPLRMNVARSCGKNKQKDGIVLGYSVAAEHRLLEAK
jgi:hypothetical protein